MPRMMIFSILCVALFSFSLTQESFAGGKQREQRKRALIIGIDGAKGPQVHHLVWKTNQGQTLKSLMTTGEYSPCESITDSRCARIHSGPRFQKGYAWESSPGWASVLTGVDVGKHRVKSNDLADQAVFAKTQAQYPTFMAALKKRGLKTAAGGYGSFLSSRRGHQYKPGPLDYECGVKGKRPIVSINASTSCNLDFRKTFNTREDNSDAHLMKWTQKMITEGKADIIMPVFIRVDITGHIYGFANNSHYLKALSQIDTYIKVLIDEVKTRVSDNNEEWLVIVTSDHGGHYHLLGSGGHTAERLHDEVIPFIITTFGSSKKLNSLRQPVNNMDVQPTVMHWFGFDAPKTDGQIQGL